MRDTMKQRRNGDGAEVCSSDIEFIGGPYDGHTQPCLTRVHLPAEVAWLVCEDAFRLLDGKDSRPRGSIASIAIYKLDDGDGSLQYRFARAMSVRELTISIRDMRSGFERK